MLKSVKMDEKEKFSPVISFSFLPSLSFLVVPGHQESKASCADLEKMECQKKESSNMRSAYCAIVRNEKEGRGACLGNKNNARRTVPS